MNKEVDLDDNVVSYILYPLTTSQNLNNLINSYVAHLNSKFELHSYIWQNDCLRFWQSLDETLPQICGRVKFADNIEDEWLVVFLLLELTKRFEDLIIQVYDDDGEFLLIEAADFLPKWLNPENAENKVFLHRGCVHILPKSFTSKSAVESVDYVRRNGDKTLAPANIQKAILNRISGFPLNIVSMMHHAICMLPPNLSFVLNRQPNLVAPLVEAYRCHNDPKMCMKPKFFSLENLVKTRVKFNRCLYAQLMAANSKLVFKNPVLPSHPDFTAFDLGLKLAMGAEILFFHGYNYKNDINGDQSNQRGLNTSQSKADDKKWTQFLFSLKNSGYFKEELEGSREYTKLMEAAKVFYKNSVDLKEGDVEIPAGVTILDILENINLEEESINVKNEEPLLPDDDAWMNIGPSDLDKLLGQMFPDQKEVSNLENLAPIVNNFIHKKSKLDGIGITECIDKDDIDAIALDPNTFLNSIKSLLTDANNKKSDDEEEDDDDDDDDDDELSSGSISYDSDDYPHDGQDILPDKRQKLSQIEEYMEEMDRQLAATEIGKSFLKINQQSRNKSRLIDDLNVQSESIDNPKIQSDRFKEFNGQSEAGSTEEELIDYPMEDSCINIQTEGPKNKSKNTIHSSTNSTNLVQKTEGRTIAGQKGESRTDVGQETEGRTNVGEKTEGRANVRQETEESANISDNVDVDFNLVKNFLDSYYEQCGLSGPVTNILHGLGLRMPPSDI